jgi:hypothetical protein
MSKWMLYLAGFILIAHGLIHLMGTTVYMRLGDVNGFSYKTTLLGGRWDVGSAGISLFGALWAVAAVGFIASSVGMLTGSSWWQAVLIAVSVFSLLLTGLDSSLAFAGIIVNLVILALLFWSRRSSI